MAKAQGKKAAAGAKKAAKKVATRVKSAVKAAKKKGVPKKKPAPPAKPAPKKPAPPAKPAPKKPAPSPKKKAAPVPKKPTPKKPAPKKPAPKPAPKPVAKKAAEKVKTAVKVVKAVTGKVAEKIPVAKVATPAKAAAPARTVPPVAPVKPPKPPAEEKKRGRRARTRIHSDGVPVAAWLSSEKPRPASFIPAPPRAEAPSAIAAPPASSDRLIRPEDISSLAVRTVPVRIDVEHGAGRFYVIASPAEVTVKVGEGIEWDFRYIGGADVSVDEIIVEFDKPSPFPQAVFRTRKPGSARPHRALSGGSLPNAAGKRIQYRVKAMTAFKTELANTDQVWVNVTA